MLNLSPIFAPDQACERSLAQLEAATLRVGLAARLDDNMETEQRPGAQSVPAIQRSRASCPSFRFLLCHQSTTQQTAFYQHALTY